MADIVSPHVAALASLRAAHPAHITPAFESAVAAKGLDWAAIWALVQKYGPLALEIIQELLNPTPPVTVK